MEYIIRDCKESDIDSLVDLCSDHAKYERAEYTREGKHELLRTAMFSDKPNLYVLLVVVSGKIGGYASYTFDFSTWESRKFLYLDCLYIAPELRSYGIGESLMRKIAEIGSINNCVNMQWQTPAWNDRAIKFYQRLGGISKEKIRFSLPLG